MTEKIAFNQYAVRISVKDGSELIGSGVLFIGDTDKYALVITAAHIVDVIFNNQAIKEKKIYLTCTDEKNQYHKFYFQVKMFDNKEDNVNNIGNVFVHPKYDKDSLKYDIAMICIPWEQWMKSIYKYRIGNYRIGQKQEGWGYPLSMNKEWEGNSINEIAGKKQLSGQTEEKAEKGYKLSYHIETTGYKIKRDSFAEGFSGTGLFEDRDGFLFLIGIVSQACGDETAGTILWASEAIWIYEINEKLLKNFQRESEESSPFLKVLLEYCEKQIALAHNSSLRLKKIETSLYPDLVDDDHEFIANENQSALLKKIESVEQNETLNIETRHLVMIGEGGIGKTATMLGSCCYLLKLKKPALYVPFRALNNNDTLNTYILREILENCNEMYDYLKSVCYGKDRDCKKIYLFLDGFNELKEDQRVDIIQEIENWSYYKGIQIIISSRRTLEEDGNYGFLAQRITMRRLKWEKVVTYLKKKKVTIPDKNQMSEILGIPLMLKLYTVVQNSRKDASLFFKNNKVYDWKDQMFHAKDILWNYIQCQIYNAETILIKEQEYNVLDLVVTAEYIAPFIASRMNAAGCYIVEESLLINWLYEGINLLQESSLTDRIDMIKRRKNLFKWNINNLDKNVIFFLLVYKLNLLHIESDDRISFEHQDFQDILHYIYIEESIKYPTNAFYIGALTNSKMPYDILTLMSEMINENKICSLWSIIKDDKLPSGNFGIYNMIELYKRRNNGDLSGLDLSGLDLRNTNFSGCILSKKNVCTSFQNAIIGSHTFLTEGHNAPVTCVDFSPAGGKFVSASYDKTLRIWNTETGECLAVLNKHSHYVRCVAWSPNEDRIVSGGDDTSLIIWDVYAYLNKKETIPVILNKHKGWIYSVSWSCNGNMIASGDSEGMIYLWQMTQKGEYSLTQKISSQEGCVKCLKWSPIDYNILVSGHINNTVCLWNIQENSSKCLQGFEYPINFITWSPDGDMIAVASGNSVYIWNVKLLPVTTNKNKWYWDEGEPYCIICMNEEEGDIISSIVWAEGFIAFSNNKKIYIWDILSLYQKNNWMKEDYDISIIEGHTNYINDITWSNHLKKLVSGADDSTIRIWKARNPAWNKSWGCICLIEGNSLPTRCVAWSPDSKMIIAGYDDNTLRKWDIQEERCCMIFKGHEKRVKCADWAGDYIVSGSNDNTVRVWDSRTGICIAKMSKHKGAVNCVMWLPDGKHIVSGSDDNDLYIWNFETDEIVLLSGHKDSVYCVALSADKKILVSGSNDRTIRFWNVTDGKCHENKTISSKSSNGHQQPIRGVACSPDSTLPMLISASNDNTLRRWNIETNNAWIEQPTMYGHKDFVYCLSWSPLGKYVVSGSTDNTLWIWDTITGEKIFHMEEHTNYVPGVAWSPCGKYISSASCDGRICIWNVTDISNVYCLKSFSALPFIDIIDCDFTGAVFESKELQQMIKINGGIVGNNMLKEAL